MAVGTRIDPLAAFAVAAAAAAAETDLRGALAVLAPAVAEAGAADLVVVRVVDAAGDLVARAVAPPESTLAAAVAGSRGRCEPDGGELPCEPTRRAAERARAATVVAAPVHAGGRLIGVVELVRVADEADDPDARVVAELAAAQVALVVRALGEDDAVSGPAPRRLELAGEALAAAGDAARAPGIAVQLAAEASGAVAATLWRVRAGDELEAVAAAGRPVLGRRRARELAAEAVASWQPAAPVAAPELGGTVVTLPLGQPPFAVLQLLFDDARADLDVAPLVAFAARLAHALRAADRSGDLELELERTRALVEVVGEAISRLSLAHTLETSVERIAELLGIEDVGVYLLGDHGLDAAAGRGHVEGHEAVAQELLTLALGPLRARAAIAVRVDVGEPTTASLRAALSGAAREAVVGVPLHVREELIGLLIAYPPRELAEGDVALLASLAAQLAVAVQNARLHEQATDLGTALGDVLTLERQAARQLRALYEISRSFAQSLSLDTTLDAVTKTIVEVLDVDAAVIRAPDERGDSFVPRSVHVADDRLAGAVRTILDRPQPRPARTSSPAMLDSASAARIGGAHALLVPFLDKGSTAALLPIATSTELLAELTILSLDPAAPIDEDTLVTAGTIAQQAALAIDNARLYQQQKAFAETMQQSLLPRERPAVPGLEVGAVYESAAQVDVGGDVFDFLELSDGRLAVVLGDVTGHGIDATADMAMAKFTFRSLAREHPEPSAFLAHANDVVVGEIAVGKFITMAYLAIRPEGEVLCASAGHPAPRLVAGDGTVSSLDCGGLALGIDAPQEYEQIVAQLQPGGAVVLYTDGVIEARRDRKLFGMERLDAVLAEHADRDAQGLADAVIAACRAYSGGQLTDDCAIVVIKRT